MTNKMNTIPTAGQEPKAACSVHEWVVFSTAMKQHWLMLQCVDCDLHGTVEDPTEKEWSDAYYAPSRPYRWSDESRVHVKGTGPCWVMRVGDGPKCACYDKLGVPEPDTYERVPVDIIECNQRLSTKDRMDLKRMAAHVATTELCSRAFPYFVGALQEDTGYRFGRAIHQIAARIRDYDSHGMHLSSSVVARVLSETAEQAPRKM